LGTTTPPQSPVAWSSFATCKNPGGHGIYDYLRRNPETFLLIAGVSETKRPVLAADGSVERPATTVSFRKGRTFWSVADEQGVRSKVFNVPYMTPPDNLMHGTMLSGTGVSDIRRTDSISFGISDKYSAQEDRAGGVLLPLKFDGNVAELGIPGHARVQRTAIDADDKKYIEVPVRIVADRTNGKVGIDVAGKSVSLQEGEWSPWIESEFQVTPKFVAYAISRFYLIECGEYVRIYMTCFQNDPRRPYSAFTHPSGYAGELADRYGLYKTVGWAFDTRALAEDWLTEDGFLDDVKETMAWRERLTLDELDADDFDLLVSAWTATDRVAHMFWRFRDPEHPLYKAEGARKYGHVLEDTYIEMDRIVGNVIDRISDDDLLMVLSDHGFGTWRIGFNVNTWLVRNGYAMLKGQPDPSRAASMAKYLQSLDWSQSRAYGLGLSSVYVNMLGRERDGIVPEDEVETLVAKLRDELMQVTFPGTGEKVFKDIYTSREYSGLAEKGAPDLVLAYRKGYQNTKASAKGCVPRRVFEPCRDKWSGEHSGSDARDIPGMLFCNRSLSTRAPHIIDLGVTALDYLGKQVPSDFEGTVLI